MAIPVVKSDAGVTVLGGGNSTPAMLSQALTRAKTLVCADGAAQIALEWGYMPDAVVGDFDSWTIRHAILFPTRVFTTFQNRIAPISRNA